MKPERYPLGLSILATCTTCAGLSCATLGLKWGSAPAPGDALPLAWLYVHIMLGLTWLLLWPALALRPKAIAVAAPAGALWDALALAIGALPAVIIAGVVSAASPNAVGLMFALQAGCALLAAGIIACAPSNPLLAAWAVAILAGLTLIGPILVFISQQFFRSVTGGWLNLFPLVAIGRAATAVHGPAEARALWAAACGQMLAGVLLLGIRSVQEKTPGTQVPRA